MFEARDGCASALEESAAAVAISQRIGAAVAGVAPSGQPGQPLAMRNDVRFYLSTRFKAH